MVEIVDLALRAVIDLFEIYTINCFWCKKKSILILLCPKLYLEYVAQLKQTRVGVEI